MTSIHPSFDASVGASRATPPRAEPRDAAAPAPGAQRTFARRRLRLGIAGVGMATTLAALLLATGAPHRLLPSDPAQPVATHIAAALAALCALALVHLPLDWLGGARVVHAPLPTGRWLGRWARGAVVQLAVWTVVAASLLLAARAGGAAAAWIAFAGVQVALVLLRPALARATAALRLEVPDAGWRRAIEGAGLDATRVRLVHTDDAAFVGGWTGARRGTLWVPAHWRTLPGYALHAVLARRRWIAESGAHARGLWGAAAWNAIGAAAVLALAGAPGTASALAAFSAGMTLWAFLGVLLLPTPSRWAVYAADAAVRELRLHDAIVPLDRWQDDEPARSVLVETVFHPVPARDARLARLEGAAAAPSAWTAHHLARHALFLAWGAMTPISRAVHCNVGRPALWVMLPGD
jgi:hypothetical protein